MKTILALIGVSVATPLFAGPLVFHPNTITTAGSYGHPPTSKISDSTVVVNTSNDTVTLSLTQLISKIDLSMNQLMFTGPMPAAYAYKTDSSKHSATTYREYLSRTNRFPFSYLRPIYWTSRNFDLSELRIAPHDSVAVRNFQLSYCVVLAVRASANQVFPYGKCQDEPLDLVFGSTKSGYDTLHVVANNWMYGAAVLPRNRQHLSPVSNRQYSANGRFASPNASTILLDPTGAYVP